MFVESFYHIFLLLMHPILKSCQVNLHSSLRDNNKAVKYSDQSENSSWHVLGFEKYRLVADWSVKNVSPNGMADWSVQNVNPRDVVRC